MSLKEFSVKEMGWLFFDKFIELNEEFVKKNLDIREAQFKLEYNLLHLPQPTGIKCPFCKDNEIMFTEFKPQYSGGMCQFPSSIEHVGNDYNFRCKCGALFVYHKQWAWID